MRVLFCAQFYDHATDCGHRSTWMRLLFWLVVAGCTSYLFWTFSAVPLAQGVLPLILRSLSGTIDLDSSFAIISYLDINLLMVALIFLDGVFASAICLIALFGTIWEFARCRIESIRHHGFFHQFRMLLDSDAALEESIYNFNRKVLRRAPASGSG